MGMAVTALAVRLPRRREVFRITPLALVR